MRRHASSLALFIGGFLVAATVIQISHAQGRTAPAAAYGGGGPIVHENSSSIIAQYGNKLYKVPVYDFQQSKVRSVTLK
jgi:hypothetical protein